MPMVGGGADGARRPRSVGGVEVGWPRMLAMMYVGYGSNLDPQGWSKFCGDRDADPGDVVPCMAFEVDHPDIWDVLDAKEGVE